jgi:formylmethanofuran dehydrogenase subunit E
LQKGEGFHGSKAQGIILGVFMVGWGLKLLGGVVEFDALMETSHCLADAFRIYTSCNIGNG